MPRTQVMNQACRDTMRYLRNYYMRNDFRDDATAVTLLSHTRKCTTSCMKTGGAVINLTQLLFGSFIA